MAHGEVAVGGGSEGGEGRAAGDVAEVRRGSEVVGGREDVAGACEEACILAIFCLGKFN